MALVSNALKYNRPRGSVTVATDPADVSLVVNNTGPSIGDHEVQSLLEPFRRMSGERLDHEGGVGLGMTIVRSIVAAHHGEVMAEPGDDGGLTVTVRFPCSRAHRHGPQRVRVL